MTICVLASLFVKSLLMTILDGDGDAAPGKNILAKLGAGQGAVRRQNLPP